MDKDIIKIIEEKKNLIEIPPNLDNYIKCGIKKGQSKKPNTFLIHFKRYVALILVVLFITAIRISPTFASAISKIPGLEYIVNLINNDKGLTEAVENNYVQHVDIADTHDGIAITIKDIIIDQSRIVVFLDIENQKDYHYIKIDRIRLKDINGNSIPASFGVPIWENKDMSLDNNRKITDSIDFSIPSYVEELPDKIIIEIGLKHNTLNYLDYCTLNNSGNLDKYDDTYQTFNQKWEFEIPIDKQKLNKDLVIYNINREININNQKIILNDLYAFPTRTRLDISYDDNNSMKIFGLINPRLIDNKGNIYKWGSGSLKSTGTNNIIALFFEGMYFHENKEIYLEADGIKALDKDKLFIEVDLENEKLLTSPDNNIRFEGIEYDPGFEEYEMIFGLHYNKEYDNMVYSLGRIIDNKGNEFWPQLSSWRETEEDYYPMKIYYNYNPEEVQGKVKIELTNYPNYILQPIKIKIK